MNPIFTPIMFKLSGVMKKVMHDLETAVFRRQWSFTAGFTLLKNEPKLGDKPIKAKPTRT